MSTGRPHRLSLLAFGCLALGFLLVSACGDSTPSAGPPSSLVGHWVSDPSPSQLGQVIHTYDFTADGGVSISLEFLDAKIPAWKHQGRYEAENGVVKFELTKKSDEMAYRLEGDVLVLKERNGDTYRLQRR